MSRFEKILAKIPFGLYIFGKNTNFERLIEKG